MTNQKLEELKKKIVEAVPEIMELDFGTEVFCEQAVEDESGNYHDLYGTVVELPDDDGTCKVLFHNSEEELFIWPAEPTKILGRDITLEDILSAIGSMVESIPYTDELWNFFESFGMKVSIRNKKEWRFNFFGINQSALAFPNIVGKKVFEGGLVLKLLELYCLGQPLHLQSEECVAFLWSILCTPPAV